MPRWPAGEDRQGKSDDVLPLRRCTTIEGVTVNGGLARTIVKGAPGLQSLELDLVIVLGEMMVRVCVKPRKPVLIPMANVTMVEPE